MHLHLTSTMQKVIIQGSIESKSAVLICSAKKVNLNLTKPQKNTAHAHQMKARVKHTNVSIVTIDLEYKRRNAGSAVAIKLLKGHIR